MKGVPFFNGRYMKGVPFLSKMVYKRVRGWTSGGASPFKTLLSSPPGRQVLSITNLGHQTNLCRLDFHKIGTPAVSLLMIAVTLFPTL